MLTQLAPVPQKPAPIPATPSAGRMVSVDALRGFDMFWIIGAASLVKALEHMRPTRVTDLLATQFQHVQWVGLRFYDLIFPLFLFLIGVSIVFSLDKALVRDGVPAALWRILRRSVMLYLLGIFANGGLTNRWPDVAMGGVLQRIAACYFFAATFYCFFGRRPKVMATIAGVLLVGYWTAVTFVPFPDLKLEKPIVDAIAKQVGSNNPATISHAVTTRVHGVYEEGRNLTNYLDFRFLPGRKAQGYYINEGLLSTIPAIAICLFGTFAGRALTDERVKPRHKVGWLMLAGLAAIGLGLLWSLQFPLIKRIWTSSFCLVAAGYASMMLGLFYLIVDVWRLRMWCQPLVWIGTNPITIYLMAPIIGFSKIAERLVGGDAKAFFDARVMPGFGGLVVALVGLGLAILLCGFLYRKKIFLRV